MIILGNIFGSADKVFSIKELYFVKHILTKNNVHAQGFPDIRLILDKRTMDEKSASKYAQFVTFGTCFHHEEPIFSYVNILQKCSS